MAELRIIADLVRPIRAFLTRFRRAERNLAPNRQEMLRNEAKQLQAFARFEAPQGRTGRFRQSIVAEAFETGTDGRIELSSGRPIGRFIRFGTKPHLIRGNPILAFQWAAGPAGPGTYFYRKVQHPGTKPDDFAKRAVTRWLPRGRIAVRQIGLDFVADLKD